MKINAKVHLVNGWVKKIDDTKISEITKGLAQDIVNDASTGSKFDAALARANNKGFLVHTGHGGVSVVTAMHATKKRQARIRKAVKSRKVVKEQ